MIMYAGGDAAEQIVRISLEGVEVAAKITGEGAKNIAILLMAALKEEHKTKGKARLSNMIKSGKELKVFSVQNKDLKKFAQEAKRYGVLYNALKDMDNKNPTATVDIIARAEDASKIQRIMDRFELASVDKASIINEIQKERAGKQVNPDIAKTEKSPLSEHSSKKDIQYGQGSDGKQKTSVREKLRAYATENMKLSKDKVRDKSKPMKKKAPMKSSRGR